MLTVTPRRRRRIPHGLAAAAIALLASAMLWHASQDGLVEPAETDNLDGADRAQYSVLVDLGLMILGR